MVQAGFGVEAIDNTTQGLQSAYNNVTKMTAKMAKKLVMEASVKFPDIANEIQGFESDLRKANSAIGKFQFLGERFGKNGRSLGLLEFDSRSLKGNLSAEKLDAILPKLKEIYSGLSSGSIKSADLLGLGGKELDYLGKVIERLETVQKKYNTVLRSDSKRTTELTSQAAKVKQLKQEKNIKEQIEAVDNKLSRLAASDKSERDKLKEELELLKIKERYLKKQDRLSGIPEAEPSADLVKTKQRIEHVKAMQKLSNIYTTHNNLLTKLRNAAGQYFSIQGIRNFIQKVAEVTGYYERQQVALEGILRSASDAQNAINELKQLALNSPFQVKDLVSYTKQLAAFGVETGNLIPTVSKLADISTGLGVDMSRIILAYGQVKSATVLRGQELRQFTEAGIPMVDALAKKFTALNGELVTTADVFDLISKRQVSFDMVSSVMSDMASEGGQFYNMQERITDTLAGQIEKLKDTYDQKLNDIGGDIDGLLMRIVKFAQGVVKNTRSVSAAMMVMIPTSYVIREIARMQLEFAKLDTVQRKLAGNWWKHAMRSGGFLAGVGGLAATAGLGIVIGLITKAYEEATKLDKEFEKIERSFAKETSNMISGLDSLAKKITVAKIGTKEFVDAVDTLAQNYGDFISDDKIQALKSMGDNAHQAASEFSTLAENIKIAIQEFNEYQELKAKEDEVRGQIITNVTESDNFRLQVGNSGVASLAGSKSLRHDLEELYGHEFGIKEMLTKLDSIFDASATELLRGDDWSEDAFKSIFEEKLRRVFKNINDTQLSNIINSGITALRLEKTALFTGKNYEVASDIRTDIENTDYHKLNKALSSLDLSKVVGSPLEQYEAREDAYRAVLTKTGDGSMQAIMSELIDRDNTNEATEAFKALNDVLEDVTSTPRDVANAFKKLDSAIEDDSIRHKFNQIGEFYKKGVDLMTDKEEELYRRLNSIDTYKNEVVNVDGQNRSIQEYFESWNPATRGDKTIEHTREEIAREYDALKKKKDGYPKNNGNGLFNDEIEYIDAKLKVLETIAGKDYYAVDLSEKSTGSKTKQVPVAISELINEIKTAYTRYKEATQKGGVELGLDYVRTNQHFQEMFGQFFNGIESDAFKKISSLSIGGQNVGDMLKDAFITDGLETGILDFRTALVKIKKALEDYGNADVANRKAYLNAAKAIGQWVDTTFSKDNLDATLLELENELKQLTNTFERANQTVDLYSQLRKNGTAGVLGASLGITKEQALRPRSELLRENVNKYIDLYNGKLPQDAARFDAGNLSTIDDVYKALDKLERVTKLNNAFDVTDIGTQAGKDAKELLKELLKTLIEEAKSISGEVYTGNTMQDLIANAKKRTATRLDDLTKHENVARSTKEGMYDWEAIKQIVEANQKEATRLFDQFIKDNNLDVLAKNNGGRIDAKTLDDLKQKLTNIAKGLPDLLRDELLGKIDDLERAAADYNAKVAAPGSIFGAYSDYRNAGAEAKRLWDDEDQKLTGLQERLEAHKNGTSPLSKQELDTLNAEIMACKARIEEMGGSVEELEENLKQLAIANLQKSAQEAQSTLNAISGAANSVIDVFKSLSGTINKVYDIMNDGENPEWMKEMDGFINDFGQAFNDLIAPITAVMAAIVAFTVVVAVAGTTMAIVFGALIAVAAIFAGVIAACQSHDRNLQNTIEDLDKQIEDTKNAMTNLDAAAERMVGFEKFSTQLQSNAKNLELYRDALAKAKAEEAKKDTDPDKVKEFAQEAQEYHDAFLNNLKTQIEEMTFSIEDVAGRISDAMRTAFQNGENAARAMRDAVKEAIGDMVQKMMDMYYLMPRLEEAFENYLGMPLKEVEDNFTNPDGSFNWKRFSEFLKSLSVDPEKVANLESDWHSISEGLVDWYQSLPEPLQEAYAYASGTSEMSGGVSGITEDTARALEGIGNSSLAQLVIANNHLANIQSHLMATIQTSWFNSMLKHTESIARTTAELKDMLYSSQVGSRPLNMKML